MTFAKPIFLAASLGLAAAASAGEPTPAASAPPPNAETFAQLDINRDGVLSFSESFSNPRVSNNFNLLDLNADGVLSRAEVQGLLR
jgi:hypothetical protein